MKLKNIIYCSVIIIISILLIVEFITLRYPKAYQSDEYVFDNRWTGEDFNKARESAGIFYKIIKLDDFLNYFNYTSFEPRFEEKLYDGYTGDDVIVLKATFDLEGYERYLVMYKRTSGRWAVMGEGDFE